MDDETMQMIEDCERREDRLDDWSSNFIDSIRRQLEAGRNLTLNQKTKLEEIWQLATERG